MPVITLRVDDALNEELEALARGRGMSKSDLLREGIGHLLKRRPERARGESPRSLTFVERALLARMHQILARLSDGDDREGHEAIATALEAGYVAEYHSAFASIEPELSEPDCTLVMDILDMFRVLKHSYDRLTDADRAALGDAVGRGVKFEGFDRNDRYESALLGYAEYLVDHGRWEEQADFLRGHGHGNSHRHTLPMYERMLAVFQPIWEDLVTSPAGDRDGYLLTASELARVVDARVHPDHRST